MKEHDKRVMNLMAVIKLAKDYEETNSYLYQFIEEHRNDFN